MRNAVPSVDSRPRYPCATIYPVAHGAPCADGVAVLGGDPMIRSKKCGGSRKGGKGGRK